MTRTQLSDLNARLDVVGKSTALIKWIVAALIAATVWGTTLQVQVQSNTKGIEEIQLDRRGHIKDAEAWRREVDLANVKRDQILESLSKSEIARAPRDSRR